MPLEHIFDMPGPIAGRLGDMTKDEAVRLAAALCFAAGQTPDVSEHGHGNICPAAVQIGPEETVALDPKHANAPSVEETEYAAPERFWNGTVSPAGDVYSIGLILYAALNHGRLPFIPAEGRVTADYRAAALKHRMNGDEIFFPDTIDESLCDILQRALAFRSEDRFAAPMELREALSACTDDLAAADLPIETGAVLFGKEESDLSEIESMMSEILDQNAAEESEADEAEEPASEDTAEEAEADEAELPADTAEEPEADVEEEAEEAEPADEPAEETEPEASDVSDEEPVIHDADPISDDTGDDDPALAAVGVSAAALAMGAAALTDDADEIPVPADEVPEAEAPAEAMEEAIESEAPAEESDIEETPETEAPVETEETSESEEAEETAEVEESAEVEEPVEVEETPEVEEPAEAEEAESDLPVVPVAAEEAEIEEAPETEEPVEVEETPEVEAEEPAEAEDTPEVEAEETTEAEETAEPEETSEEAEDDDLNDAAALTGLAALAASGTDLPLDEMFSQIDSHLDSLSNSLFEKDPAAEAAEAERRKRMAEATEAYLKEKRRKKRNRRLSVAAVLLLLVGGIALFIHSYGIEHFNLNEIGSSISEFVSDFFYGDDEDQSDDNPDDQPDVNPDDTNPDDPQGEDENPDDTDPDDPENNENPDDPENGDDNGNDDPNPNPDDNTVIPNNPSNPNTPNNPTTPNNPSNPNTPNNPTTPNNPNNPNNPDNPPAPGNGTSGIGTPVPDTPPAELTSTYTLTVSNAIWRDARNAAEDAGGHLATITSEEEFLYLTALAEEQGVSYIWLGGYRKSGNWIWTTGEAFTYAPWHNGKPSGADAHYVVLCRVVENGTATWGFCNYKPDAKFPDGELAYITEFE